MQGGAEKVKSLSRKWYPKPPKSFDSKIHVNPIHLEVFQDDTFSLECIDWLVTTNYLNLLWDNFTQDASVNHIELLLLLLRDGRTHIDMRGTKFDDLLVRVLSSTNVINENTNFRSLAYMMDFLARVSIKKDKEVSQYLSSIFSKYDAGFTSERASTPEMVKDNVKRIWVHKTIEMFFTWTMSQSVISPKAMVYVESFFTFWIAISSENPIMKSTLNEYNIGVVSRTVPSLGQVVHLPWVLDSILREKTYEIEDLQRIINDQFPDMLGEFAYIPSKFTFSAQQLKTFLSKFSLEQLETILFELRGLTSGKFIESGPQNHKDLIISTIIDSIYVKNFIGVDSLTESVILDNYLLGPIYPLSKATNATLLVKQTLSNVYQEVIRDLNKHIGRVLERITVDSNDSVKSTSKYFHSAKVEETSVHEFKVTTAAATELYSTVALLEIIKPNKYALSKRMQQLGLNMMRIALVTKQEALGKKATFSVVCEGSESVDKFAERVNYVVFIPQTTSLRVLSHLNEYFNGTQNLEDFLEYKLEKQAPLEEELSSIEHKRPTTKNNDIVLGDIISKQKVTVIKKATSTQVVDSLKRLSHRSLIVTSSTSYVHASEINIDITAIPTVKYGDLGSLKQIRSLLISAVNKIKLLFDDDKFDVKKLSFYNTQIRNAWSKYLQGKTEDLLATYPFDKTTKFEKIGEIVLHYTSILESINFIKNLAPIWESLKKMNNVPQIWKYLFMHFNVIISYDDYLDLHCEHQFANIILVNANESTLPIVLMNNKQRVDKLVVIGGEALRIFPEIEPMVLEDHIDPPPFNPGFKHQTQFIRVDDQVEEAEFCVLLFEYMTTLGYPAEDICIVVANLHHKALVSEVLANKGITLDILVSGAHIHDLDSFKYAIISLYGSEGALRSYGKYGSYFVGAKYSGWFTVPKKVQLEVCEGEKYGSKTRSSKEKTVGREYLEGFSRAK